MSAAVRLHFYVDGIRAGRCDINILNICLFPHIQPHFPIKTTVGQIINDKAEGRDFRIFGGIQLDGDKRIFAGGDKIGDLTAESGISAAVVGSLGAVYIDGGYVAGTVKL